MASDQDVVVRLNSALSHRYRIESEIGSGGMATVYLAQDLEHDRKVAVKVIKTTANLQHPHIVSPQKGE
jgi:serine/threonine-protein kinase